MVAVRTIRYGILLSLLLVVSPGLAAPAAHNSELQSLRERLFPVLSRLDPNVFTKPVKAMLVARMQRRSTCADDATCLLNADVWRPSEIELMTTAGSEEQTPAIRLELEGVNTILQTYGLGSAPRYPEIDGPELENQAVFKANVAAAIQMAAMPASAPEPQIDPSLTLSLTLLDVADRLDPVERFGEYQRLNLPALHRAKGIAWTQYRYAAILALGIGPDDRGTPLSALGKMNVEAAAQMYAQHQAPFIIVSGGSVHPRKTHFVEAFEMRKALIANYGVPAEAIIVDPFARHTTTNVRNASRLLAMMKAPRDKPSLIVSNAHHIAYVVSPAFQQRNMDELGYEPVRLETPTSATTVPFYPNPASGLIDPRDPLDP